MASTSALPYVINCVSHVPREQPGLVYVDRGQQSEIARSLAGDAIWSARVDLIVQSTSVIEDAMTDRVDHVHSLRRVPVARNRLPATVPRRWIPVATRVTRC